MVCEINWILLHIYRGIFGRACIGWVERIRFWNINYWKRNHNISLEKDGWHEKTYYIQKEIYTV